MAPLIAMGRQPHHPPLAERFEKPEAEIRRREAMAHRLNAKPRSLALRKQTPEPVFGIVKSVLGFVRFDARTGKARGEWSLATMAWNIKRMFALNPA